MKALISSDDSIKKKIYTVRGLQVMLDSGLAEMYVVPVKVLNQAVKRNIDRFPHDFMFQLSSNELDILRSQIVTTDSDWSKKRYLPFLFTEQGVASLSGILKSKKAIDINIKIMRAFVAMRTFISKNAEIFYRIDTIERKQIAFEIKTDTNFDKIFDAIQSKGLKPEKGIFFDGQVFDAYQFVSDLIRSASKSIVLIDNYLDDSVLTLLHKRNKNVKVKIFTKISKQFLLDIEKYNTQYPPLEVHDFKLCHDRFLIIDNKEVYHFGASLKDLGKKWFAFSKFDKEAFTLLEKLKRE